MKKWNTIPDFRQSAFQDFEKKLKAIDGKEVEIDDKFLFNNQWNTKPIEGVSEQGLRIINWIEYDVPNKLIKWGYYVEVTEEMKQALHNRMACGYCGNQQPRETAPEFCDHCLDSEYLKSTDLHMLRMQAVDDKSDRAPLTDEEKAILLPKYKEAQIHGSTERGRKRLAEKREQLAKDRDNRIKRANEEHDGFIWLMDRGVNTDNVIYYHHTKTFSFGWRKPIESLFLDDLKKEIEGFPFKYEIKT